MICTDCGDDDGVEFTQEDWEGLDISVIIVVCESWQCLRCLREAGDS